jgi:hypothetical protein
MDSGAALSITCMCHVLQGEKKITSHGHSAYLAVLDAAVTTQDIFYNIVVPEYQIWGNGEIKMRLFCFFYYCFFEKPCLKHSHFFLSVNEFSLIYVNQ